MLKFILSITIVLVANASIHSEQKLHAASRFLSDVRAKEHLGWDKTVTRWGGNTAHIRKIQSGFDDSISWEKVVNPDAEVDDNFGVGVAISNDIIVVTDTWDDTAGTNSGAVYLFRPNGDLIKKLVSPEGNDSDHFGVGVAVSDEIVLVGFPYADKNGRQSGSVYIFRTDGDFVEELLPSDGGAKHYFGWSVAISDGIILVGALGYNDVGSVYQYRADGQFVRRIHAHDSALYDQFGWSVAISDGIIVVGSRYDDDNGNESGSVYLYRTDGVLIEKLLAPDGEAGDFFNRVAISDGIILVGAPMHDDDGAVYLFRTDGHFIEKLVAPDGAAGDQFGRCVAISADVIVVGAPDSDDNGVDSGSVYLYRTDGEFLQKLVAPDGAANDWFGRSVAILDDIVIVGADSDNESFTDSGSAYILTLPPSYVPSSQPLFAIGNGAYTTFEVNNNIHSLMVSHIINGPDDVEIHLYNKNCIDAINQTDAITIMNASYIESKKIFSYAINLDTTLMKNSSMVMLDKAGNNSVGHIEFCTEIVTKLGNQSDSASSLEVSFKKTNYLLTFDLSNVSFIVGETASLEVEEIQNNTEAVDIGVSACICSVTTFDCVPSAPAIQQNEKIFICLAPSSGVEISNFAITFQNGQYSYVPIQYGTDQWEVVNEVLTDVEENESALRISAVLVKGLFDANSSTVNVSGNAFLRLSNGKSIQNRMTFSSFELEFEIVGEEEESGGLWSILPSILAFLSC